MNKQLIIGFATEGNTDFRFLESIIQRSFEKVIFESEGQIEVLPVHFIKKQHGEFIDVVIKYSHQADKNGVMILCIHCDADDINDNSIIRNKINPAIKAVNSLEGINLCTNLVPIVPVVMTESWILSDTDLLKAEIGTIKSNIDLGIDKFPESYRDPKQCIKDAIRIARQDLPKRRRHDLTISELYLSIGQNICLKNLERLPSYQKFKEAVKDSLKKIDYLR